MKLSNKFTFVRVFFAPVFFVLYFLPIWTGKFAVLSLAVAIPCLIFSEFTDYLDGYYARKHNEVSDFGKIFDPFADVVLHLTSFACLMFSYNGNIHYMPIYIFILIMLREYSQIFLRMTCVQKGTVIAARKGGKIKTVMYITAEFYAVFLELLVRLDAIPAYFGTLKSISFFLFVVCLIMSYVSFVDYLIHFGKILKQ